MLGSVLIVDDDVELCGLLGRLLEHHGYQVAVAHNARAARQEMKRRYPDAALIDLGLPDADGKDLMVELRQTYPHTVFLIITGAGTIRSAVESTRLGASDYLTKPFDGDEVLFSLRRNLEGKTLHEEVARLRSRTTQSELKDHYPSRAMREVMLLASRAANQDGIVLLMGESGTGKDHLARWIHRASPRKDKPFFSINCAAVSKELAESELFGHEPGSFTSATGRKRGLLELARGGTLLLNEVGEFELPLQAKLLTFLDTRTFMRVGGERAISVDARIFAATNRSLAAEVEQGTFRADLYYRLNVLPITLPPLRNRVEDIPQIAGETLLRITEDLGLDAVPGITPEAMETLCGYAWPGNIRELRNVLERAVIVGGARDISVDALRLDATPRGTLTIQLTANTNLHEATKDVARWLVREALRRTRTKNEAAKMLGISRHALAHQIRALDIEIE